MSLKKVLTSLSLSIALLASINSANAATTTLTATAKILTKITFTAASNMNFGNVAVTATGDTVVLSNAGSITSCGTTAGYECTGTTSRASVTINGTPGETATLSYSYPSTLTSGANTMSIGTFTPSLAAGSITLTGGSQTTNIGATLTVGTSQASGTYNGSITVTANY